ncbi:hypothetical protein TTHERM_00037270 (macronuclear) [Tetrahymena thermophila SB210]|uniref:Uncharacterized protein n=1 Tax=Tetrahymena thermophila (strain SB210) TaxID=312017 RepID=Q22M92_TETTS|nr:hypothetical protein TTHERM_00037270 [Tetrahymena thermophila SB210]EAR86604.2 hypothetical protein TTHERM_00037270 [Tetrahymena thermophila SB210]|eukprot:XP_977128.2 hypothetical protein TTHERM_00037270 [Tetrahymena thermophila SB210]
MRKYKSTDSHYLEQATRNYNFVNLKKSNNSSSNSNSLPSTKATIRPIDSSTEEQIPYIRENTQVGEDKQYHRLPDDIFINEEPLYNPSRQHFSIFKSINAYKKVSYTMMDKSKNVVHCFLEEKNPISIQCSQWSKLADRYSNTLFAPLAETIQEFYMKREDWNESLSVSTKDESCQILPEYSNSGVINNLQNGHIFLNQFQLAQEKEDVNYIEKILSSPHNQQPQIIFRRMFVAGKGTILRSIHINTSFLNMVNFSTEDFLLCTAIRKALPDIFYSLNYIQIMKKALFKIDNSQQQEIFNHSILTANNQQIDIQCRYEGANMPYSKLVILKITNQPSISYKFSSASSIEQNNSNSNPCNLAQLNKKRKLFEREDIVINNQQSKILQCAFGFKIEDETSEETSRSQSSSISGQQSFGQSCTQNKKITEQVSFQQQQTNQHISQIEKIFKLRVSNY